MYIRIAKGGEAVVSKPELGFTIGRAIECRAPGDVLFVTTGVMLQRALEAAAILEKEGVSCGVVHCHTIKPFDAAAVLAASKKAKVVLSVEEHTILGGLEKPPLFRRLGIPDVFPDEYGSQNTLLDRYGLSAEKIAESARRLTEGRLSPAGG